MQCRQDRLRQRAESIRFRINSLTSLRRLVDLPAEIDITERQWSAIEPQLAATSERLSSRVRRATDVLLPQAVEPQAARDLSAALGQIELDMATAFTFFDTYMDVLTQRRSPELGAVLGGCDVLALEAMRRDHPALATIEPPLVHCDRGFAASTTRQGVPFPDGSPNPMPLIQIPYARLKEKYNLASSIPHEVGHQGIKQLQLLSALPKLLRAALDGAGAPETIEQLYELWAFEIGPDFWAFGLCGVAEAAGVRELFALPPAYALRISITDPHPPPYLRALLCFDWCRRAWGQGVWDEWERDWLQMYPLERAPVCARGRTSPVRRAVPCAWQPSAARSSRSFGRRSRQSAAHCRSPRGRARPARSVGLRAVGRVPNGPGMPRNS
jgi:hypothetical protein